jgi:hypothetical protein
MNQASVTRAHCVTAVSGWALRSDRGVGFNTHGYKPWQRNQRLNWEMKRFVLAHLLGWLDPDPFDESAGIPECHTAADDLGSGPEQPGSSMWTNP